MDVLAAGLPTRPLNILLVAPQTPDTFWSFNHILRLIGKKAAFPPLGLLTVAALLPREWNLRVVDLNVRTLHDPELAWADAVFVSAMMVQEASAREVIARARAHRKPVVAGGPLFTTGAERFPEVDCCVIGEAEEIIGPLAADLAAGRLKPRYEAAHRPDLALTPLPRWDLVRLRDYATLSLQTSRGCPFDCEFCDITAMYGRSPRVKSPAQVVAEFDAAWSAGWRGSIFVVDDNFIGHREKTKAILRALIAWRAERGVHVDLTTEASLNLVDDPELVELMVQAGFRHVFVGIESPDEDSLKECRKVQNTRRDMIRSVRTLHQSGLQVMAGFIVGFDSDKANVFEQQHRFIQRAGVVTAMVGMLTALPGTRLFGRLASEGRIVDRSTGNNLDGMLNFVPRLDPGGLIAGYRRLLKDLYAPREYYRRALAFLRQYRPPATRARLTLQDVRSFIGSLWVMGVATPGRREFWKFLYQSWRHHRAMFAEAVAMAIRGHHFRQVAAAL